ncbi:TetR/AcrR family transcriptional regulator [Amycolatopsis anabasis]|uniref:TetR/AcrR family transcriptional regulator n=1 Tax=Amycolatopsis anabasis TaxID=1840409 RepID=UPI00131D8F01|nr:TetR/AcrR family transcriptional regulator [Amycolatopsis anabasis]
MSDAVSRRRGEALERAILDAAWEILTKIGYSKLTMEAVAAQAGTSRPVIHRRWPTRAELVLAAMDHRAPVDAEPPDTGTLRSDLLALLNQVVQRFGAVHGETLAGLITETARDPDTSAALRARIATTAPQEKVTTVVARAADREEINPIELPPRVTRLPFDLIRNEVVLHGCPPTEDTITEIVDEILLPLLHQVSSS